MRRSFVPPVRDEEHEIQRKAHAKRVRETRRSTQVSDLHLFKGTASRDISVFFLHVWMEIIVTKNPLMSVNFWKGSFYLVMFVDINAKRMRRDNFLSGFGRFWLVGY